MRKLLFILFLGVFTSCENPFIGFGDETIIVVDIPDEEVPEEEEEEEEPPVDNFNCLDSVILKSQAEVDAFGLQQCEEIGGLWIEEIDGPINNLLKLNSIKKINGYLHIKNTSLFNFQGLDNLKTITGTLLIQDNSKLFIVNGLQNTTSITEISIINNDGLTSVEALNSLSSLRNLTIIGNPDLVELDGLHNLKTIEFHLLIQDNITLLNINSFDNITQAKNITLAGNNLLSNFCAFKSLIRSSGFTGDFITQQNLFNPTEQDVIDGNCSL